MAGTEAHVGPLQTQGALLGQQSQPWPAPGIRKDLEYFEEGSPDWGAWFTVPLLHSKGPTDHEIINVSGMSCKHSGPKRNKHVFVHLRSQIIGK